MTVITVRADTDVERALADLGATAGTRSQIVREAILAAARTARSERLRAEAAALAANDADRAEVAAVQHDLDDIRAW
ncbi:hypothetical protein [Pilimelia columellifera]|uniref:Ribbon-helix-helix protein CopG domain-containing protein n=1 Tax=Pilimelia columellifera subsp. columellifera TaxID=706583 RepID=A0ABN3NLM4_9ACTN